MRTTTGVARTIRAALVLLAALCVPSSAAALPFHGTTGDWEPPSDVFHSRPYVSRLTVDGNFIGTSNFYLLDQVVNTYASRNSSTLILLTTKQPSGGAYYRLPDANDANQTSAWYWFVRATASHYRTNPWVQDYEIWNEPNDARQTGGWGANPGAYVTGAYCLAARAIRDAGSSARIWLGGVADRSRSYPDRNLISVDRWGLNPWLGRANQIIGSSCPSYKPQGISFHYYSVDTNYGWGSTSTQTHDALANARSATNSTFGSSAMLNLTETGYPDNYSGDQTFAAMHILDQCWADRDAYYVRGCYWWPLRESGGGGTDYGIHGGLLYENGSAKPAYTPFYERLAGGSTPHP